MPPISFEGMQWEQSLSLADVTLTVSAIIFKLNSGRTWRSVEWNSVAEIQPSGPFAGRPTFVTLTERLRCFGRSGRLDQQGRGTRTAFAAAVSANNEAGAAALTSFPLKNRVYKEPPKVPRKAFSTVFADYRNMAFCIKASPLVFKRGAWLIDCDGNILRFGSRGGRWLDTVYENVNE